MGSCWLLLLTSSVVVNVPISTLSPPTPVLPAPFWHRSRGRAARYGAPSVPSPARHRSIPSLPAEDGSRRSAPPTSTPGPRGEPFPAALAARASWPPEALHPDSSPVLPKRALDRQLARRPVSEGHVENSPPCHSRRAFGPSKRPFTRLPLRACGPWVRIAPPLLSGLRQALPFRAVRSTPWRRLPSAPRPPRRRARHRHQASARRCSLGLHRSHLPPMPSRRMAPRSPLRRAEPPARAANRPQLHSPRGPSGLRHPSRPSSTFPAMPTPFPLDNPLPRRDHRTTNTPRGTHGGIHHVIVGRARSTGSVSWHRPLPLLAHVDRRFGYLPTRACTRPALRAGG
jgi:hypothetical protein